MITREVLTRNRFIIVLTAVVVVVYGVLYAHILRNFPDIGNSYDTQYVNISEHVVSTGVYSTGARDALGNIIPTVREPPLFTLLYAASFKVFGFGRAAHEAMRMLQIAAGIGVIVISWRIGAQFSARAANVAAVFAAFDLTAFYFAQNYYIPDVLLGFFLAGWLLYVVKFLRGDHSYRNMLLSTMFLGFAMWTKIAPFLLWVPWGLLLAAFLSTSTQISRERKVRLFAVFAIIVALFFGGWKMRNFIVTGTSVFASGATSLRWNAAHLVAYQRGMALPEARQWLRDHYFSEDALGGKDERSLEEAGGRAMTRIILGSPIDFGIVVLRAMPGFFLGTFPPYMLFNRAVADTLQSAIVDARGHRTLLSRLWFDGWVSYMFVYALAKIHLLLLYGSAIMAVVACVRRRGYWWTFTLFLLTIIYVITVSGAAAQARYRTMIMPIVYVLGGVGVAYLWECLRRRRASSRGGATGARTMVFP